MKTLLAIILYFFFIVIFDVRLKDQRINEQLVHELKMWKWAHMLNILSAGLHKKQLRCVKPYWRDGN